ncbi:uncharacterized protein Aud_005306 [Aspergillus udagawae]|uniref:Uncharacterized protein n=1 Tax=Aspergillus udagawae TaxID=91492 RepID=A0A8E0V1S3_9EURO|nr:uncharacterized protein Aud_005306 [Aspergillus udagawae]GIC88904.1 hypothetical protein Aud_005306 [Aspergillus udagawae]
MDAAARLAGGYKNIKLFIIWDDAATFFLPLSTSLLICACRLVESFSSGRHVSAGSRGISIFFGENFRKDLYVGIDKAGGIVDLLEAVISSIPQSLGSGKDWGVALRVLSRAEALRAGQKAELKVELASLQHGQKDC